MAPHVITMAPLLGIEPHSSPLAKQFYREPIHNLTTDDLGLMHQHTVNALDMSLFIIVDINHLGKFPFVSIRDFHQNYNVSTTLKFLLETNHFCLFCKVTRNSLCHLLRNSLLMCCTRLQHFYSKDQVSQTHQVEASPLCFS